MANRIRTEAPTQTTKTPATPKEESDVLHVRLPVTTIQKLDELAAENSTSRNAIAQIAISKLIKSGL